MLAFVLYMRWIKVHAGKEHTFRNGLSNAKVAQSREKHGANIISKKKKKGFWSKYVESFADPIIRILLIALAVNILLLFNDSGWYESAGIAIAIIIATFVSTLSEYGSEAAFEKLQKESNNIKCRVKRNNILLSLPISELVVGDIVLLQAGERIPADGHIITGEVSVDQSALNGESKEARKYCAKSEKIDYTDLSSSTGLFQGSVICDGEGIMRVDLVGEKTFYGKMAVAVQEKTVDSPLKMRLQKLAKTISRLGYTAAVIVAVANLFHVFVIESGFNSAIILSKIIDLPFVLSTFIRTITLSITVIVMAVPEGLPMMITVVLSANMRKMLKDHVLVRKLVGIETAGSLNILFTDKTGTLTKGKLTVTAFLDGGNVYYDKADSLKKKPFLFNEIIKGCIYNTDAAISGEKKQKVVGGNNTDRALLQYASSCNNKLDGISLVSHVPFNSKNKFSISHIKENEKSKYIIKGAPEIILDKCIDCIDASGSKRPFSRVKLNQTISEMGTSAIRMIALAQSDSPIQETGFKNLTLVGIIGIRDEIRKEACAAIQEITGAGIQTIMITGDNKETAVAIAKDVGLLGKEPQENAVFTSHTLSLLSDEEIKQSLKQIRVVARALPTDKSRLVRIAQEMGLVAGMTGDGINDAPALKKADVGFAMGSGTEVAKEAGDIIIVDDNIKSISKAVLYGRTIFKSIRKFIIFQLSMNLSAVGISAICPFLNIDEPLTVIQMLWVNMIMDTLGGLAFSGEAPLKEYMKELPKKRDESIINRYMYSQILFTSLYTILLCILFLKSSIMQNVFHFSDGGAYFMTAFFALFIFINIINSFNARTERINIFSHLYSNWIFVVIMLFVSVIQIVLIYLGGTVFRTTGISIGHLEFILIIAMTIIPIDIMRKCWMRKNGKNEHV